MTDLPRTPRTTPRRKADRVSHDRDAIAAVLDQALVVHVGLVLEGQVLVVPLNAWRVGEALYFHLAPGGRLAAALAAGTPLCVSAVVLDGLVLARSAMHHSMNYRSAMVFGAAEAVTDQDEKARLLSALVDHVVPGRAALVRPPDAKELAATAVFRLDIAEASLKSRSGPPVDRADDRDRTVPAGVVPLTLMRGPLVEDRVDVPWTHGRLGK